MSKIVFCAILTVTLVFAIDEAQRQFRPDHAFCVNLPTVLIVPVPVPQSAPPPAPKGTGV
jgi:hypothetical protein